MGLSELAEWVRGHDGVRAILDGIELSRRFHLYVAVCASPRVARALITVASRTTEHGRVSTFDVAEFRELRLPDLLRADGEVCLTVVDASRARPEHRLEWARGLRVLNERRNLLTAARLGPMLLCVPSWMEPELARSAPDLWSIRSEAVVVEDPPVPAPPTPVPPGRPLGRPPRALESAGGAPLDILDEARAAFDSGDHAVAARRAAVVIRRLEPDWLMLVEALRVRGRALAALGDHAESRDARRRALEYAELVSAPTDIMTAVLFEDAESAAATGDRAGAVATLELLRDELEHALEAEPEQVELCARMAKTLAAWAAWTDDDEDAMTTANAARDAYERVAELEPDEDHRARLQATGLEAVAAVYERASRLRQAAAWWAEAARLRDQVGETVLANANLERGAVLERRRGDESHAATLEAEKTPPPRSPG